MDETHVMDLVCGMRVALEDRAATSERAGVTYHFCCEACLQSFEEDPDRYLRRGPVSAAGVVRRAQRPDYDSGNSACRVTERLLPERLSTDGFEDLVWGEWRRRQGSASQATSHPTGLIRAFGRAILAPDDRTRAEIKSEIDWRIADLCLGGVGRQQIGHELAVLARAIEAAFWRAGVPTDTAHQLIAPLDDAVEGTLPFPSLH